jgi:hypothetical protein
LSHDCFVYRLSMFEFPFTFSVVLFCFVCLPAVSCSTIALSIDYHSLISPSLFSVLLFSFACLLALSCPTIALSIDYQCLISPSLVSVLLSCFVCLPSVSCPTVALSMDYQCLISPSLFSNVYLYVMLSIPFPSIVRYTRCTV